MNVLALWRYLLIDFDVTEDHLIAAIFGGPAPAPESLRRFLTDSGIRLPARVIALSKDEPAPQGAVRLRLHPGLDYWFVPWRGGVPSKTDCVTWRDVIRAIQQANLLFRRSELSSRHASRPSRIPELAEVQAFHLALQEVRESPEIFGPGLELWIEIVLERHQAQINEVRRRFVEFISALTRGVETPLAYPFFSVGQRIYSTFRLAELAEIFPQICREIGVLVAGRVALHPAGLARSEAVRKAFVFMEAHFTEPMGLAETAKAAHVSAPHLARLFRQETGRTVVEYLQLLRVTHAKELLTTGDQTTLDVALDSGFASIEHFHRIFRRVVGTTPRAYRISTRV